MTKKKNNAISPTRTENYPEWYQQVVKSAELAETSAVRGCMVIKPWGYALWENLQKFLDSKLKETGHVNAYFPLFIPKSYLEKEAEHVDGFAKECAVVTHHRLEEDSKGGLIPAGELEEPLIVRPTSETIIGETYSKWVQSYRDLPILINQWANVVRWEMRTRLFLRTTEFLWQEGHTAHETKEEALDETYKIIHLYKNFLEEYMAIPIIVGEKTENERFPGAIKTLCIEAMMQDGKALQAGTSHFLGQNFSKASNIKFQNREGKNEFAWTTSWGVSTRLIGGLIMTHADDDGMIMPPKLSPNHIVIIPHFRDELYRDKINSYCNEIKMALSKKSFGDRKVSVLIDSRDINVGEKSWSWIKKGIPLRIEIGPKEIENESLFVGIRDTMQKKSILKNDFIDNISKILEEIQNRMFEKASNFQKLNTKEIKSITDFNNFFNEKNSTGFAWCHFCGDSQLEKKISDDTGVTIRLLPINSSISDNDKCIFTGKKSIGRVLFARSY